MPILALQLPLYTHRYSLTIFPSFCFVACALYTIVIRFILANCLLLNLLCCALKSRPSCSSMQSITCLDVTASCMTHILWLHHLCSYASCYTRTLRPWKNHPAQLLVHVIAYHCSSLHCCLQTGAPSFRPSLFGSHCRNSGGFGPPVVVVRDKQWFQTTLTPLVPEKHQWQSEFNTVLQCTAVQTLYTSLSTLVKFKLP